MSYTVEYNPELRSYYPLPPKNKGKLPIKVLAVVLGIIVVIYTLNTVGVLHYVIPGDPAVTVGAISDMVDQVRSGQTVSEAILIFFKEVITGGM